MGRPDILGQVAMATVATQLRQRRRPMVGTTPMAMRSHMLRLRLATVGTAGMVPTLMRQRERLAVMEAMVEAQDSSSLVVAEVVQAPGRCAAPALYYFCAGGGFLLRW
jgi:hypothetical protein